MPLPTLPARALGATLGSILRSNSKLDPEQHFRTDHLKADLGRRSARATAYTGGAQAISLVLRMAATVVLARLLTPEDYGLFGMVTVVVSFVTLFNDFGLSMATIQKETVTHAEASTLFWINVGVSAVLAALLIAISPVIVWFYHEPRLFWLNVVLALSLLVGGLRVQHGAILRRQMRFGMLALVDLSALVFGIAAGIFVSWLRRDYWGLVAMHWGTCLAACVGTWFICAWIPGLPGRLRAVRSQLHFGTRFTGSQLLGFLTGNLNSVLIGRYWGAVELGLYNRAYQLLLLPVQQVSVPLVTVGTPAMSRVQSEPERFKRYYCRAMNLMALAIVPFIAVLTALAQETVLLVLGPSWIGSVVIFKALAIAGAVEPFMSSVGWIMVALGHGNRLLHWSLLCSPVIILSFIIGLPWGALGVAVAYAAARCLLVVPSMWFALRGTPVRLSDIFGSVWRPFCLATLLFLALSTVRFFLPQLPPFAVIGICLSIGLAFSVAVLTIWSRAREEVVGLIQVMRQLFGRIRTVPNPVPADA